jgi:hypothetical protein
MKTAKEEIPDVAGILRSLVWQPKALDGLLAELAPHFSLVDPRRIVEAAVSGEAIRILYPGDRPLRKDEAKQEDAHAFLACSVLYWWFNIRNSISPGEQTAYILKQNAHIQYGWAMTIAHTHMPASRALLLECLRKDLYGSQMAIAFREFPDFWGEPARFIPADEVATWKEEARDAMHEIVHFSKDEKFRREVTKVLYNDPNRRVRRDVRYGIRQGKLPDVREQVKDAFPEEQQKK